MLLGLVTVIALFQASLVTASSSLYLYMHNTDPIQEYTGTANDFTKSTAPKVVEFYSPHCPACIDFKNEYIHIAKELLKNYSSEVEFYAVSCDAQPKICDELVIEETPSLYLYPSGHSKGKRVKRDDKSGFYSARQFASVLGVTSSNAALPSRRMDDSPSYGGNDADEVADGGDEDEDDDDAPNAVDGVADDNGGQEGDDTTAQEHAGPDGGEDDNAKEGEESAYGPVEDDKDNDASVDEEEDDNNPVVSGDGGYGDGAQEENDDRLAAGSVKEDDDAQGQTDTPSEDEQDEEDLGDEENVVPTYTPPNQFHGLPGPGWKPGPGGLPQVGGGAVQRNPNAGHNMARNQPKALDRYKDNMKNNRMDYEKKRQGIGRIVRRDNRRDKRGKEKVRHDSHAMTDGMKAFTPGTDEYTKREGIMKKRVQKAHKKLKIPIADNAPLKKDLLRYKKDVRRHGFVKKTASNIPFVGRRFRMTPEEELILDVSLSLVVGFETGIKFKGQDGLDKKQQKALRNFLDLLNVALPPEWGIHRLIDEMRRRFAYIIKERENLQRILDHHPLPRRTWSPSCVQPSKGTMGFSCGFWKLLHVTTVGIAEQRGGLSLVGSGMVGPETQLFSPIDAADTIRDYIESFFNCQPCREEFVKNYDDCEKNRRCDRLTEDIEEASIADWKELPVWLWETHNEVSVRIMKEKELKANKRLGSSSAASQRNLRKPEIAVIWPNIDSCFLCFHEDGTWDEAEVFKHLESTYWPDSDMDPKSERLIQYEDDGSFGFGLLLWIAMFVVLGVVYSAIGKTSPGTWQQGFYQAKRMVNIGPSGKKMRSN